MKTKALLFIGIISTTIFLFLSSIPVDIVGTAYAGQDLENFKLLVDVAQQAVGTKFFSRIVQSKKMGTAGSLKITVTSKFLRETKNSKEDLMKNLYDLWQQQYKGPDEALIAFVDSKNTMIGMASKVGCMALP